MKQERLSRLTLDTTDRVIDKTGEQQCRQLPDDCTLLPLFDGMLLVSPTYAVFCRIPLSDRAPLRAILNHAAPLARLSQATSDELARHGFFDPPRPTKPERPTVQLQLTNGCNLACAYCCTNSGQRRAKEVSLDQMRQVVQQIPTVCGANTHIALLGGEPLLVPWALELAAEIVQLGLGLTIFTNGIPLIKADLAKKTAALMHKGVEVRVSLAGPSPATCDSVSGAARFQRALLGLHQLAEFGVRAIVDLMIMPQAIEEIVTDLPELQRRLPPNTPIALGVLYWSGRETGEHLFKSRAALEAALDRIAFECGVTVTATETSSVTYRREGCPCALGQHVHIRSDGALFNCFKMEEMIGHLETTGFAAAAQALCDHPHCARELPSCAGCPLTTLCGGGCRSENLLYTGNPDASPCGPWRVRVLSELLAENRVTAVEWPLRFLLEEARSRGIETPPDLQPQWPSRHLLDV